MCPQCDNRVMYVHQKQGNFMDSWKFIILEIRPVILWIIDLEFFYKYITVFQIIRDIINIIHVHESMYDISLIVSYIYIHG